MTSGKLFPQLLRFILPVIASNLLQATYNMADTVVAGLSSEPNAVGTVGGCAAFTGFVINAFIGCSVGSKVIMARALGERDDRKIAETFRTSLFLSVILGFLCGGIGFCLSGKVLALMGNHGRLYELALTYTRIYFLGTPFISACNFCFALLYAAGNTKTPMVLQSVCGVLNVFLNLFFVLVCRMSVEGVALATLLSNMLCAAVSVLYLFRGREYGKKYGGFGMHRDALLQILRVGLPAGIQSMLFSVSHMLIQSSVLTVNNRVTPAGSAYDPIVKGVSACTGIESFVNIAVGAVAQAVICFTGRNYGSQNFVRIRKIRKECYGIGAAVAVAVGGILILARNHLLALYGVSCTDGSVLGKLAYDAAVCRMFLMFVPYFLLAFMEVGAGLLQGMGRAVTAAGISLLGSCVFRILWILFVFPQNVSLSCIFVSFPISWLLTAAAHGLCFSKILKSEERKAMSAAHT